MKMHYPIITIGRQFGSGGRELGKVLSRKLGIPFYDKELLHQAAREAGINPEFFIESDERMPSFFGSSIQMPFATSIIPWQTSSYTMCDNPLYQAQSRFIHSLAEKESCIIVGRTADYVLRDIPGVVNVFVCAALTDRADRIMSRCECANKLKAIKLAEKMDKLRASYYNFYTDKRWGDPTSYDITFNSSVMSIESISDVLIEYIRQRHT